MKRIAAVLLAVVLAFSLSACGEKVDPEIQKKNEETLASVKDGYLGQYLGDGTYQFEDITYEVNQNLKVKASESPMPDDYSYSFTYFFDDSGFVVVMHSNSPPDKKKYESEMTQNDNPDYTPISLVDIKINGLDCFQYTYNLTLEGKERFYSETYVPCGDNTLSFIFSDTGKEPPKEHQAEYEKILSSIESDSDMKKIK